MTAPAPRIVSASAAARPAVSPAMSRRDLRAGNVAAGALAVLFVAAAALPFARWLPMDELLRTSLWGLALVGSFAGWGTLVARSCWPEVHVGIALRCVFGASLLACAGGVLACAGLLRGAVLAALVLGGLPFLASAWAGEASRIALGRKVRGRLRAMRANPAVAAAVAFVALAVAIYYLGGASDIGSNPYDDDVSYYPLAKQLVDRGTLIDPFSFRRMSTLGGQTLFHALLLTRVQVYHLNVFERGICVALACALVATARVGTLRIPLLVRTVAVLFLLALPNTAINSASHYSGLVFFLGLALALYAAPDAAVLGWKGTLRRAAPLALVAAATCTLRQNYQFVVAAFLLVSYALSLPRAAGGAAAVRREALAVFGLTLAFVIPWLILLYRSNGTFLFPLLRGTMRASIRTTGEDDTFAKALRFFVNLWLSPDPITTLPIFALVALFLRDAGKRSVLSSLWLAGIVSVFALAFGFTLADPVDLARYTFGFLTAAALLAWLVAAARMRGPMRSSVIVPGMLLGASMLVALESGAAKSRKTFDERLRDIDEMTRRSVPPQLEPPIAGAYRRVQEAVPAGARLVVMLEQPFYLDYARNEIWSLDMPGAASPGQGIPCYLGPEAVASYFAAQNIRYVAFVQSEHATYLYRHEIWFDHLFDAKEIWRTFAPTIVDVMSNLAELAKTRKHLHDEDGLVVVDLESRS